MRKMIALLLIGLTTFIYPASAFADGTDNSTSTAATTGTTVTSTVYGDDQGKTDIDEDDNTQTSVDEDKDDQDSDLGQPGNNHGKGYGHGKKSWKEAKDALKKERAALRVQWHTLEKQLQAITKELKKAVISGDTAKINEIKQQLMDLKTKMDTYKLQMKTKVVEMRAIMKAKYTLQELNDLQKVAKELQKHSGIKALPVDSVVSDSTDPKFDTPPVIKDGRTLLPIRAITESMGAQVTWDQVKRTVTITKGDKVIVFDFTTNKVYVNGKIATIDVPAQILNKRTMVPLRFIATNLGVGVSWDQDSQTVEIE